MPEKSLREAVTAGYTSETDDLGDGIPKADCHEFESRRSGLLRIDSSAHRGPKCFPIRGTTMAREVDEIEERPRRRKKKRSSKSLTRYLILGGALGVVGLIGAITLAVILLWSRVGPQRLTTPERYVTYNSP